MHRLPTKQMIRCRRQLKGIRKSLKKTWQMPEATEKSIANKRYSKKLNISPMHRKLQFEQELYGNEQYRQ